jgi:hypothetical protein
MNKEKLDKNTKAFVALIFVLIVGAVIGAILAN